jgi:hypothetical protein
MDLGGDSDYANRSTGVVLALLHMTSKQLGPQKKTYKNCTLPLIIFAEVQQAQIDMPQTSAGAYLNFF